MNKEKVEKGGLTANCCHRLSIDCGKKPGVSAMDGMRRCRVLLEHPARTPLDLRLLAQVEVCSSLIF